MDHIQIERILVAMESLAKSQARIAVCAEAVQARKASPGSGGSQPDGAVASEYEMGGEHGNPVVKKDPKNWKGPTQLGNYYSDCPPEYLDVLASLLDWKAGKNDDEAAAATTPDDKSKAIKYAKFARLDARRARGWAARLRGGWKPEAKPADPEWTKPDAATPFDDTSDLDGGDVAGADQGGW